MASDRFGNGKNQTQAVIAQRVTPSVSLEKPLTTKDALNGRDQFVDNLAGVCWATVVSVVQHREL
jgi:hypothetical protein